MKRTLTPCERAIAAADAALPYAAPRGVRTRRVRCLTKIAFGRFAHYGRRAIFTTAEGVRLVGVLTDDPRRGGHFPVIAFPDGRWGRADDLIVLVDEAVA